MLHLIEIISMTRSFSLLDPVAITVDLPSLNLVAGQVGTIVEELGDEVYEVEFSDDSGRTYALGAIAAASLIALHYEPAAA